MRDIRLAIHLVKTEVISSDQLVQALEEILVDRAPIGKLALRSGILTVAEVGQILYEHADNKKTFGETAVELKLLTEDDIKSLMTKQMEEETSICDHLVSKGTLSQEDTDQALQDYRGAVVKSHDQEAANWVPG